MSYCSDEVSNRIRLVSFLAMLSVFLLHWSGADIYTNSAVVLALDRVVRSVCEWAVPFFFIVSGFFFDRASQKDDFTVTGFLRKKFITLAIPYAFWGAVWGAFLTTPLIILNNVEKGAPLLARTFLSQGNAIDNLLGLLTLHPVNTALWYVRALLMFFVFASVWRRIRDFSRLGLLLLSIAILAIFSPVATFKTVESLEVYRDLVFQFKVQSIGWLLLGMSVSAFRVDERDIPPKMITGAFLSLVVHVVLIALGRPDAITSGIMRRTLPLTVIIGLWGSLVRVRILNGIIGSMISMTFWAYCMHVPICGWSRAITRHLFGYNVYAYLFDVTVGVSCGFLVCWATAILVRKISPKSYSLLAGGR